MTSSKDQLNDICYQKPPQKLMIGARFPLHQQRKTIHLSSGSQSLYRGTEINLIQKYTWLKELEFSSFLSAMVFLR